MREDSKELLKLRKGPTMVVHCPGITNRVLDILSTWEKHKHTVFSPAKHAAETAELWSIAILSEVDPDEAEKRLARFCNRYLGWH